ncbi:enolase C-terminal domain-like protein, partial [Streptomyces olivaceoviridis]
QYVEFAQPQQMVQPAQQFARPLSQEDERGAAGIVQPDVARIGGVTPWLKVAHLAEAFGVEVCPHFLMEIHVSLAAAVSNARYVEYIPQLRAVTRGQLRIVDGFAHAPQEPGLGIAWDRDAIDDRRVA